MKVIHVITRLDKGGSADITLKLSLELQKMGYEVSIISGLTTNPVTDMDYFTEKTGIKIKIIPYLQREISPLKDLLAFFYILKSLLKEQPHIVHLHTSKAGFLGRIAAKLAGVKCIVYTTHGHIFYGYFNKFKTRFFITMERFAALFCDAITTLTKKEKDDFLTFKISKQDKIIPVHNGIDIKQFLDIKRGTFRREFNIDDKTILIGWVGRFEPVKCPDTFLSVCKRLQDANIKGVMGVMAGDGSLFENIKKQRDMLGLDKFLLLVGYRNDTISLFVDIDILVLTSLNEGFGMVILEAMSAAKPVIAHDVGGVGELVINGKTGYLVKKNDIDAIVTHVHNLISNKDLYISLSANAYNMAQKYSLSAMANRYENIYKSVLSVKTNLKKGQDTL